VRVFVRLALVRWLLVQANVLDAANCVRLEPNPWFSFSREKQSRSQRVRSLVLARLPELRAEVSRLPSSSELNVNCFPSWLGGSQRMRGGCSFADSILWIRSNQSVNDVSGHC